MSISITTTTTMETQQVHSVNEFDATGHSVPRMNDTDDHDDSTFSMTASSNSMDDEEYPMEDISLSNDEEAAAPKVDAGKSAVAALFTSISHDGNAISKNERPSNRDQEGFDDHSDNCSIQTLETIRNPDSIRSLPWASTREDDVKELCSRVRSARNQRAYADGDAARHDQDLALRLKDFYQARELRSNVYRSTRCGIFPLFVTLGDVRLDLAWAEDAAWRREQGLPVFSWVDFDNLYSKRYPRCPFTYLIVILSTIMLVVSIGMNGWKFAPIDDNPMIGPDQSVLLDLGALFTPKIVEENEWYRLVTPIVLHAGIIHYVINMLAILMVGTAVERVHGTMETAAVFMLSAVGGNMASANFMPNTVSVGASGGIYGLLGICLADVLTNWDLLTITDSKSNDRFPYGSAIFWLSVDLVVSLGIGLMPYVDNFAHLGGFFFGICFGLSLLWRFGSSGFFGPTTWARHYLHYAYAVIGAVLATSLFTVMFVLLLESDGRTTVCPSCRYISCAPFPFWTKEPWWYCDECEQAQIRIVPFRTFSELELTCPNGDIVTIELMDPDPVRDEIQNQIPGYCRQLC
jgi:membrane associated rhomboid family serine protease